MVSSQIRSKSGAGKLDAGDSLTHQQPLRHAQPLWLAKPRTSIVMRKVPSSDRFDVIVVGAGIGGALMAHSLSGKGLRILTIDRRHPVRGSSAASTAMIQHEIDVPLHRLARTIGHDKASRVWRRSAGAVEELKSLIRDLGINCEFQSRHTLFLSGQELGARALKKEAQAREEVGILAEYLDRAALLERYGINRSGAINSAISASSNPVQMTTGILRAAKQQGVEVVEGLEVTDVREVGDNVIVATDQGKMIEAANVIFCSGYEFLECLRNPRHKLMSTWALASKPRLKRPDWLDNYLVWEASDPYLYFRSTSDGRVIVGGEDEKGEAAYLDPIKIKHKTAVLVEKLADLTGISLGKPDFSWSAAFGVTPDGLPMIGTAPGMRRVFVSMGFGGNGITFAKIAADLISATVLGHQDVDWDLFPLL
ncbi:NAD(P)/FAD-dependent oxidoreductase [Rhizobium wenxiniae]|uniref:NAD(P)/FAD-dependent oxidoreductase n=1 Tax=Rhizobium wenxiniae TaxID=1737357 RepID=UPI003C211150